MEFTIARLIVSGMLFFSLYNHPYSYFTLLRWIVFGVAALGYISRFNL